MMHLVESGTSNRRPAKTATSASSTPVVRAVPAGSGLSKPDQKPHLQPKAAAPKPSQGSAPQEVVPGLALRKKELLDTVVARTGHKKKDVKPVVEAMLDVLGIAIAQNRELNLQPFGRVMVRKERHLTNGRMLIAKIRQSKSPAEYLGQSTGNAQDD